MNKAIAVLAAVFAAVTLIWTACSTTSQRSIAFTDIDMRGMLAEAGFTRTVAETPGQNTSIQLMPQGRVFSQPENGRLFYIYADFEGCRCMFVGDGEDYARFEQIIEHRGVERSQCIDERLYSIQAEAWRDRGGFEGLCR